VVSIDHLETASICIITEQAWPNRRRGEDRRGGLEQKNNNVALIFATRGQNNHMQTSDIFV